MPNSEEIERFLTSIYQNQDEDDGSAPLAKRFSKMLLHPVKALTAFQYLMKVPLVRVAIPERTDTPWLFDPRRPWRHHGFISSYIELPVPLNGYFQGTAKQNLRTRARQAQVAGFEARAVKPSEIIDVIAEVFTDKGWAVGQIEADLRKRDLRRDGETLDDAICVGVFDSDDHVVGFCVGTQTGDVVRTLWSCTSRKGTVRWLCFSGYVEEVSAKGGRVIVESAPWAFTGGNKIFAGHLGFAPARIRSS